MTNDIFNSLNVSKINKKSDFWKRTKRASHPKNSSYDIGKDWHETSENISYSEFLSFFLLTIEQWQVTFWGSDAWHVPLLYYSLIGKKWFHTSFVRVDMGLSWQLLRQISNYDKNCSDNLMTTKRQKRQILVFNFMALQSLFLKYYIHKKKSKSACNLSKSLHFLSEICFCCHLYIGDIKKCKLIGCHSSTFRFLFIVEWC